MGRQPWATTVSKIMFPLNATATAPLLKESPPRYRAWPPGRAAPLARPPILVAAGKAKSSPWMSASVSREKGSANTMKCGSASGSTPASTCQASGGASGDGSVSAPT